MDDQIKDFDITSPEIIYILKCIKAIQKRLHDDDVKHLDYITVYDKLSKEFDDFFLRYTKVYVSVLKNENMKTLVSCLYYRDKVLRGLMSEQQLSDFLATKYIPENLKQEADAKMKILTNKN